jgi:protein-tyrosine-phosphatase
VLRAAGLLKSERPQLSWLSTSGRVIRRYSGAPDTRLHRRPVPLAGDWFGIDRSGVSRCCGDRRRKEFVMTESPVTEVRNTLSIDQQLALRTAATRLEQEFEATIGAETIDRFLDSTYEQFASRATVVDFLPLLAERFARQRLHALERVEGKLTDGKPTVLFLCAHNAGRSPMALGYFSRLAGENALAWSGGSEPGNEINPSVIEAMGEVGIDITGEFPKPWTDEIVQAADVVITMGCGDACPIYPGKRYENWDLPDPAGQSVDAVRPIRDDIEQRVRCLLAELNVRAAQ